MIAHLPEPPEVPGNAALGLPKDGDASMGEVVNMAFPMLFSAVFKMVCPSFHKPRK